MPLQVIHTSIVINVVPLMEDRSNKIGRTDVKILTY